MFCTWISVLYPVCSLCNSTQTTPYLSHISAYFYDQNLDILFCLRTQFWIALPFGEQPQLSGHSQFQNNETQDMLVNQFIMLHNLHTEIWTSKVKLHISFDLLRKKHWFWLNRRGYTTHRQTTAFCSWALYRGILKWCMISPWRIFWGSKYVSKKYTSFQLKTTV